LVKREGYFPSFRNFPARFKITTGHRINQARRDMRTPLAPVINDPHRQSRTLELQGHTRPRETKTDELNHTRLELRIQSCDDSARLCPGGLKFLIVND
jgi:hypothetical protein